MELSVTLDIRHLHLLAAPRPDLQRLTGLLIARLGIVGPVRVIDAGNRFDAYGVARQVHRQINLPGRTPAHHPAAAWHAETALQRIGVARAFTCYQAAALLGEQPAQPAPLLVLDLLATFADENVAAPERSRLLDSCLQMLQRLAQTAPVLVTAPIHPGAAPDEPFLVRLEAAAAQVWRIEPLAAPERQLRLF